MTARGRDINRSVGAEQLRSEVARHCAEAQQLRSEAADTMARGGGASRLRTSVREGIRCRAAGHRSSRKRRASRSAAVARRGPGQRPGGASGRTRSPFGRGPGGTASASARTCRRFTFDVLADNRAGPPNYLRKHGSSGAVPVAKFATSVGLRCHPSLPAIQRSLRLLLCAVPRWPALLRSGGL